jgi:glycosyltransferase involved in cell wall biosynthesis
VSSLSISIIIITKNEARNIVDCLEPLDFANEIIILDSGSTDNTVTLARKYTPYVYEVEWPGYGMQKNRALEKAQHEWVLSIDADERVTEHLKQEILDIIRQNDQAFAAYSIPRITTYCSKLMKFGDWKNDRYVRLFRRKNGTFNNALVHESVIVEGKIGKIKSPLLHHSFLNLEDVLHKLNNYSTLSALEKYNQGKKSNLSLALGRAIWTFFRGYFLKLGFLDGKKGLMLAISNAEGCYYRYVKLMLLNESTR